MFNTVNNFNQNQSQSHPSTNNPTTIAEIPQAATAPPVYQMQQQNINHNVHNSYHSQQQPLGYSQNNSSVIGQVQSQSQSFNAAMSSSYCNTQFYQPQ